MNNLDFAIMTLVNDAAARNGIKPYEFVAVFDAGLRNVIEVELRFESPPPQAKQKAFAKMLNDIGIQDAGDGMPTLRGTEEVIYKRLESALARATTQRPIRPR